jgi:hypothetical protein
MMMVTGFTTEAGLTLICPTTGMAYMPNWARVEVIDGERYIQSRCKWCDARGHVRTEDAFDPSLPQIHTHAIDTQETR